MAMQPLIADLTCLADGVLIGLLHASHYLTDLSDKSGDRITVIEPEAIYLWILCRPIFNTRSDAGDAIIATPTLKPLTGRVARDLSSASKYAPASPPSEITIGATEALIALSSAYKFAIARVSAGDFMGDPIDLSFSTGWLEVQ